jgi:transposase
MAIRSLHNWRRLDERIAGLSAEITALAGQDVACKRLMTVPGIGPIISSATVVAIGNGAAFSKGRDFGASLGLVPKQISTGDRTILGKISRQGNRYLRGLFVQAAWVVLVKITDWDRYGLKAWSRQEAAAPQHAGDRARQQARASGAAKGNRKPPTDRSMISVGPRP